jgi:hypothetical protein
VQKHSGKKERKQKTYNLSIENKHEYIANGLLVSNCSRYALHGFCIDNNFEKSVKKRTGKKVSPMPYPM